MLKSMNFFRGKSRGRVGRGTKSAFPAPVILGRDAQSVPRILWQQGSNLVNKLALLLNKCCLREDSWDKPKNDWCRGRWFCAFSQSGRSMIEMLGVLAIIGVLSVGGIAGYSKAMEQYKLNKVLNQYSHLLQGLIEYGGKMRNSGNYDVQLGDAVNAIGLIPSTWHYLNSSGLQNFQDDIGNTVHIVSREGDLVFNLSLHANDAQFSSKTCVNFFQYIFQPLHGTFKRIVMFDMHGVNQNQWYFGDSLCSNYNCLNNMTLSAMHDACGYCAEREGSGCFLVIQF